MISTFLFVKLLFGYEIFEDTHNKYSYQDILQNQHLFKDLTQKSYSMSSSSYWLKITLHNTTDEYQSQYILFDYPFIKSITAYTKDNNLVQKQKRGYSINYEKGEESFKSIIFTYKLNPKEIKDVYIHIKNDLFIRIHFNILSGDEFIHTIETKNILETFIFSGLVILFIYNLFLALNMRENLFFFYLGYLAGVIIFYANVNNFIFFIEYLAPYRIHLQSLAITILTLSSILFLLKLFFNVIPKWLKIVAIIYFLYKIGITFYDPILAIYLGVKLKMMAIYFIFIFIILFLAYKKRHPLFYSILLGWTLFLIGTVSQIFVTLGVIENSLLRHSLGIGTLLEALIFSLVIGYHFKRMQKEAFELQAKYTFELKKEVQNRTKKLDKVVKQKNILMRELHHRVKNNLQIISGLISLQLNKSKHEKVRSELEEANLKIISISTLHDKLFQSKNFYEIYINEYILDLISDLKNSFTSNDIIYHVECESIILDIEKSIAIGLIINEIITNAIKYAFVSKQNSKTINITLTKIANDELELHIFDNGKGFKDSDLTKSFGIKLIQKLTFNQIKGSLNYYNDNGLHYKIIIPIS